MARRHQRRRNDCRITPNPPAPKGQATTTRRHTMPREKLGKRELIERTVQYLRTDGIVNGHINVWELYIHPENDTLPYMRRIIKKRNWKGRPETMRYEETVFKSEYSTLDHAWEDSCLKGERCSDAVMVLFKLANPDWEFKQIDDHGWKRLNYKSSHYFQQGMTEHSDRHEQVESMKGDQ